jgi:hypothetical protein
VATDPGAAALNDRGLPARSDRAVLGRETPAVDGAATAQRGAFLTENLAMSAATSRGAAAGALDYRAGVRRRSRVATDPGAAALNDRGLPARGDRAVLGRETPAVDGAATARRGAFLTENLAMGSATGTTGD